MVTITLTLVEVFNVWLKRQEAVNIKAKYSSEFDNHVQILTSSFLVNAQPVKFEDTTALLSITHYSTKQSRCTVFTALLLSESISFQFSPKFRKISSLRERSAPTQVQTKTFIFFLNIHSFSSCKHPQL